MANVFVCSIFCILSARLAFGQFEFQVTREEEVAGLPTITNEIIGTIEFVLHDHIVPKTTRNFRELATGQHGYGYQGSKIFRIISSAVVQGGDITGNNGNGGRSIFPRNEFEGQRNDATSVQMLLI
jgi:hypothetical protein